MNAYLIKAVSMILGVCCLFIIGGCSDDLIHLEGDKINHALVSTQVVNEDTSNPMMMGLFQTR